MCFSYSGILNALTCIITTEGPRALLKGASMSMTRAAGITVGQWAFYEYIKHQLVHRQKISDNMGISILSSILAVSFLGFGFGMGVDVGRFVGCTSYSLDAAFRCAEDECNGLEERQGRVG